MPEPGGPQLPGRPGLSPRPSPRRRGTARCPRSTASGSGVVGRLVRQVLAGRRRSARTARRLPRRRVAHRAAQRRVARPRARRAPRAIVRRLDAHLAVRPWRASAGGTGSDDARIMAASAPRPTAPPAGRARSRPSVAAVGRAVDLPAGRAEVDAALVEPVDGHRVAQHVDVAVLLRQALGERLPLAAAGAAAVDAQLALRRDVAGVAGDRHDVDRLRLVRVHVDREAEVGRQVAADLVPRRRRRRRCA